MYKNEEYEAPTVTLGKDVQQDNPFKKQQDKMVDKFKYCVPAAKKEAGAKE